MDSTYKVNVPFDDCFTFFLLLRWVFMNFEGMSCYLFQRLSWKMWSRPMAFYLGPMSKFFGFTSIESWTFFVDFISVDKVSWSDIKRSVRWAAAAGKYFFVGWDCTNDLPASDKLLNYFCKQKPVWTFHLTCHINMSFLWVTLLILVRSYLRITSCWPVFE